MVNQRDARVGRAAEGAVMIVAQACIKQEVIPDSVFVLNENPVLMGCLVAFEIFRTRRQIVIPLHLTQIFLILDAAQQLVTSKSRTQQA